MFTGQDWISRQMERLESKVSHSVLFWTKPFLLSNNVDLQSFVLSVADKIYMFSFHADTTPGNHRKTYWTADCLRHFNRGDCHSLWRCCVSFVTFGSFTSRLLDLHKINLDKFKWLGCVFPFFRQREGSAGGAKRGPKPKKQKLEVCLSLLTYFCVNIFDRCTEKIHEKGKKREQMSRNKNWTLATMAKSFAAFGRGLGMMTYLLSGGEGWVWCPCLVHVKRG